MGVCVLRPQTRGFAADALREKENYSKTCGFAAGLPPTNLPLQKGELPRRKRRRSSKHPSSFFYNCFTTINCQNWGSYYMVSPNFGRNYNCGKMAIHLHKNRCVLEPLRFSSLRIKKQGEVKNFCRSHPAGPRRIGLAQSSGKSTLPTKE